MIYKLVQKIRGVYYKITNQYLFVLDSDNSPLYIYNLKNLKLIKTIKGSYGGGLYLLNNCILDESYRGVDIEELVYTSFFLEEKYFHSVQNDSYIIGRDFVGKFRIQYVLFQKEPLEIITNLNIPGRILFFRNDGIIISWTENSSLSAYLYNTELSFLWRFDLLSLYPDKTKRDIRTVKEYQGSLLVITTAGVVRLAVADGSVIWKTSRYAPTMEIVGNIGYVCSGLALYKINLDTGEESGYGWENERLPDFTYEGKECSPSGQDVVYHDGLLWHSVYSSGHSFLIAINPENGNYEWIHHVDTYDRTNSPQFYGNKLFLSDTGGLLHIYEKEEPSNTGNQYEASL